MQPTKKPTPTEWKLVGCAFIMAPLLLGVLFVYLGNNASEEQREFGNRVANFGWCSIGLSLLAFIFYKITQKFVGR